MKRYSLQEECGIINVYLAGNGNIHLQQGYLHFSSTSTGPLVCQDGIKSKHFIVEGNKNTIFETMKTKEIFLYIDVTENPPQVIIKSLKDSHFCRFLFKNGEWCLEPVTVVIFDFKRYDNIQPSEITEKMTKKQYLQWELDELFQEADALNNKILQKIKELHDSE